MNIEQIKTKKFFKKKPISKIFIQDAKEARLITNSILDANAQFVQHEALLRIQEASLQGESSYYITTLGYIENDMGCHHVGDSMFEGDRYWFKASKVDDFFTKLGFNVEVKGHGILISW